ncbi:dihydroxyacetone kinase subunit DhaL [Cytobacillus gottheilii]|uniref:dihydroxyacetone kinase subunit DhaL n=1 Tax=Cytobacillus gottheilii TaxID=859144 RepID=UPI0009B99E36|nr:dihydroxyacetone kinase subunit DhaL [Cytobacillus gottheilii]
MTQLTVADTKEMFLYVADQLIDSKESLCEIDGRIGDGDHGFGIERGFQAIKQTISSKSYETINEIYKDIGMVMLRSMGGASGVIFSSMFLGVSPLPVFETLNTKSLFEMMRKGLEKVKGKGKAELGDKTMVDAFEPAVNALEQYLDTDLEVSLRHAVHAAEEGVNKTKEYMAKHGRAKFLYERSVGVQDAGATTVLLIFKAMYEYVSMK